MNGNLITDLSIQGGAQQLIELKVLSVSNNRIHQIKGIYGYPSVSPLIEIDVISSWKSCTWMVILFNASIPKLCLRLSS